MIVVYNPLGWRREDVIRIPVSIFILSVTCCDHYPYSCINKQIISCHFLFPLRPQGSPASCFPTPKDGECGIYEPHEYVFMHECLYLVYGFICYLSMLQCMHECFLACAFKIHACIKLRENMLTIYFSLSFH